MTDLGSSERKRSRSRPVAIRILLGGGFALAVSALGGLVGNLARKAPMADMTNAIGVPSGLRHEWRLKLGRHWQIASTPSESQETTDAAEGTRGACGLGMVEVKGHMKLDPSPNAFFDHHSV